MVIVIPLMEETAIGNKRHVPGLELMSVVNGECHKVLLFLRRSRFLITAPLFESLPEALALHNIAHAGMEARCVVKQYGVKQYEVKPCGVKLYLVKRGFSARSSSLPLQGKLTLTECCHSAPWSAEVDSSIPECNSEILGAAANQTVA